MPNERASGALKLIQDTTPVKCQLDCLSYCLVHLPSMFLLRGQLSLREDDAAPYIYIYIYVYTINHTLGSTVAPIFATIDSISRAWTARNRRRERGEARRRELDKRWTTIAIADRTSGRRGILRRTEPGNRFSLGRNETLQPWRPWISQFAYSKWILCSAAGEPLGCPGSKSNSERIRFVSNPFPSHPSALREGEAARKDENRCFDRWRRETNLNDRGQGGSFSYRDIASRPFRQRNLARVTKPIWHTFIETCERKTAWL